MASACIWFAKGRHETVGAVCSLVVGHIAAVASWPHGQSISRTGGAALLRSYFR